MTDAQSQAGNAQPKFNLGKATNEELEAYIKQAKEGNQEQTQATDKPNEQDTPEQAPEQKDTPQDDAWEKRYKDLQSYSDQRYNSVAQQNADLLSQNADLEQRLTQLEQAKNKPKAPLSDDEFESLTKDFPNVDSIAHQRALKLYEELSTPLYKEIENLKSELGKSKEASAQEQLRKLHPDFKKLEKDQDFIDWYNSQPKGIQQLITGKNTSVADVAKGLDYYKLEKGIKSEKAKKLDASVAVDTQAPTKANTTPPRKTPISEVKATMKELQRRPGKKLEEYVVWYNEAKAKGNIDFNN